MPITAKQKRIYDFIRRYMESNQEPPTIAEIGRQFQMSSPASVHSILTALEREGLIKRIPNVSRGIQLVEQSTNGGENEVPLLGTVAAGQPIEAILSHDTVNVPKGMQGRNRTFALRVRGGLPEHDSAAHMRVVDLLSAMRHRRAPPFRGGLRSRVRSSTPTRATRGSAR